MRRIGCAKRIVLAALAGLLATGCLVSDPTGRVATLSRLLNAETTFKERVFFLEDVSYLDLVASRSILVREPGATRTSLYPVVDNPKLSDLVPSTVDAGDLPSAMTYRIVRGYRRGEETIEGMLDPGSVGQGPVLVAGDLVDLRRAPSTLALSSRGSAPQAERILRDEKPWGLRSHP